MSPREEMWLEHAPSPRPHPEHSEFETNPIEWDAFISYRSTDRGWALALYDQLTAAGFKTFLDQFVLLPGEGLERSLKDNLERSASGVLVLSSHTEDSQWVDNERGFMRRLKQARQDTPLPFHYVIARLDKTNLPFADAGDIYADFSHNGEDGPRGPELVRLIHGLVGTRISDAAVRAIQSADEKTTDLLVEIAACKEIGNAPRIAEIATGAGNDPVIAIRAASTLISLKEQDRALCVVQAAREHFPRNLRLQQLEGLALRRLGRIQEAQRVLARLYVEGHRDPETMGIFAATWMMRYEESGERADLERSRSLYVDAFSVAKDNEYVGINAAAKSAFLGDLELARQLAKDVEKLVYRYTDGQNYYKSATLAEARLILGRYDEAAKLYLAVRMRHPGAAGDLVTTREQVKCLITALSVPDEAAVQLLQAVGSA